MTIVTESVVEDAALDWFRALGYEVMGGADLVPNPIGIRKSYADVVLDSWLRGALARFNPAIPDETLGDAQRKLMRPAGATLEDRNRNFHRMLVDGVGVEYQHQDGGIRGAQVRVVDFDNPEANFWLVASQFTVEEDQHRRRPDMVVFVNGLPLAIIELKNPLDETATVRSAYRQLQTYKAELPTLFACNAALVVSDGLSALIGTLTAGEEWFKPWRTISGEQLAPAFYTELQVLIEGVFEKSRFLALVRDFIVFEDDGGALAKKMAGYHQFHAVETAVAETLRAAELRGSGEIFDDGRYESGRRPGGGLGDRRIGVVWHTQGAGKSLTMAFYAGRIARDPAMENPTVVVLTDRNDLDDQLFGTFSRCQDLLRQPPVQAASRADLRARLAVEQGGVVFTTIQKFFPEAKGDRHPQLSDRRNVVVIADEAHRSQYDFVDGFARHMRDALPNASFIGFTGTPIELADANTRAVFGDYISVYDIQRAVEDGATVPIHYESRLAKLALDESARPDIDPDFEEATEGEEIERKERLKTRWAQLEAIVGTEQRLRLVAEDIVAHFDERTGAMHGKAMVVCMSRRICVDLHDELVRLRPDWRDDDDAKGAIKIVMTGAASDPPDWQRHIRNKSRREALAKRFRDPEDPFRVVLVRDMWLTGFDAPSLHTMYVDKPMRGHGLMQAIARVNRVFRDKPGGLVVDYLGLSHELKQALATYTESGGTGRTAVDKEEAVALMLERHEVCLGMLHGFDFCRLGLRHRRRTGWHCCPPRRSTSWRRRTARSGSSRPCATFRGRSRWRCRATRRPASGTTWASCKPYSPSWPSGRPSRRRTGEELDHAVRQIISRAVAPEGVIDIFAAAGLPKPDISILSDEFLAEVRGMEHRNLAVELLQKLLNGEVSRRRRRNVVQARSFAEMLETAIRRYRNRSVAAAQVIEELIELARDMREASARGEELGLTEDELAFYDALETNDSAVRVLGDETLCVIARELVQTVRTNVTIDWTLRENVRANLRRLVRRILRKHGYPPDKQEAATRTVLEQAEVLSAGWAV